MDFKSILEDYFASKGGNEVIVSPTASNSNFHVVIYYGDEEIENYLREGAKISWLVTNVRPDEVENAIAFNIALDFVSVPGFQAVSREFNDFISGTTMALSLLQETSRAAEKIVRQVSNDIVDGEIYLGV